MLRGHHPMQRRTQTMQAVRPQTLPRSKLYSVTRRENLNRKLCSAPAELSIGEADGAVFGRGADVDVGLVAREEVSHFDGEVAYLGGSVGREVEHLCDCVKKMTQ